MVSTARKMIGKQKNILTDMMGEIPKKSTIKRHKSVIKIIK